MICTSIEKVERIAGGFVLVNVAALMTVWRACQVRPLGAGDFRAWLACHEMVARRCHVHRDRDRSPRYHVPELAQLLGVSERRAGASVCRLDAAGLLQWSDSAIGFPDPPDDQDEDLDTIGRGRGTLAIPRRMLRFLADGSTATMIATTLAILLRCLSRRKAGWDGRGRVKASWIAGTFGVSIPAVKAARRELNGLGWIEPEDSDQWALNRWGRAYRIDLGWKAPASNGVTIIVTPLPVTEGDGIGIIATPPQTTSRGNGGCKSPFSPSVNGGPIPPLTGSTSIPPRPDSGSTSIPPDLHQEPLRERNQNQEPGRGRSGFSDSGQGGKDQVPATQRDQAPVMLIDAQASPGLCSEPTALPAPKLADVRVEDLKDTGRLLDLHRQAIAKGLVTTSEADRFRFVGGAEHALAVASDPAALFAWLVLNRTWRFVTQAAEESARRRLRVHDYGQPRVSAVTTSSTPVTFGPQGAPSFKMTPLPTSSRPIEPGLSEDARIVREIRATFIRAGIYRDPWPAFVARYPEWTRERWGAALVELGLF